MFTPSATLWFVLGVGIVLITPGPTNTLLAAAGLRHGMRRATRLAGAEVAGYMVAVSAWGGLLAHAEHTVAWLPSLVRMASCLYVAYLAMRMWRTTLAIEATSPMTIGPRTLFVATLLNPKAILFAGTIFPPAAFVDAASYVVAMSIFFMLVLPIGLAWIAFGAALGRGRLTWISAEGMQRCASVVLAAFSLTLAWSLLR
jgi:threonine/homoserine/homoserine lactone efflux protein